ncbi:tail fiber assembly protein [Yersinia enterocolitica]
MSNNFKPLSLFSSSRLTFYPQSMIDDGSFGEKLPDDLVEITEYEQNTYWKQSPPSGQILGSLAGRPEWVDTPPPSKEELVVTANSTKARLKAVADSAIEWRQDAVDDGSASDKEITSLASWRKYRVALMRVDTSKAPDIEWPMVPA